MARTTATAVDHVTTILGSTMHSGIKQKNQLIISLYLPFEKRDATRMKQIKKRKQLTMTSVMTIPKISNFC